MNKFHKACEVIFQIAIINILLFAVIQFIIGGNAVNVPIEDGHYFLYSIFYSDKLIETNFFIFWFSKIHGYSILATHSLAMLSGFLYWITGGGSIRPKSQAVKISDTTNNVPSIAKSSLWKVADSIEEVYWVILDSWRKPDYELFVRLSKQECIEELQTAIDNEPSLYKINKPLWGFFSGNHFYLRKWKYTPYTRNSGVFPVLAGKFSSTPQGTYIRLWHRFASMGILFLTFWFGSVLSGLTLYLLITKYSEISISTLIVVPIYFTCALLASVFVGSFLGKVNNFDIIEFVKDILDYHHTSRQLAGFRLSQKMKGKF